MLSILLKPPQDAASAALPAQPPTSRSPPAFHRCPRHRRRRRRLRPEQEAVFDARNIDTRGIEHAAGKSFFWEGSYLEISTKPRRINTELNVFAGFEPKIPDAYRDSEFLFLANIDPVLQRRVREAMPNVKLVAGDTMNYWIKDHKPALLEVLKGLDILLINDTETRMLAGNKQSRAGRARRASHGPAHARRQAWRIRRNAFPQVDPKSVGAHAPSARPRCRWKKSSTPPARATALPAASSAISPRSPSSRPAPSAAPCFTAASWARLPCERFGTERLQQLTREEIDDRFNLFRELTHLD